MSKIFAFYTLDSSFSFDILAQIFTYENTIKKTKQMEN
jgi:hypothetical protein